MEFMVSKTAFRSENDWIRTTCEVQIRPPEWRIHLAGKNDLLLIHFFNSFL